MLRAERQSIRMSKIKNGGLDQYGAGPFEQEQFGKPGVEGVNVHNVPITVALIIGIVTWNCRCLLRNSWPTHFETLYNFLDSFVTMLGNASF